MAVVKSSLTLKQQVLLLKYINDNFKHQPLILWVNGYEAKAVKSGRSRETPLNFAKREKTVKHSFY